MCSRFLLLLRLWHGGMVGSSQVRVYLKHSPVEMDKGILNHRSSVVDGVDPLVEMLETLVKRLDSVLNGRFHGIKSSVAHMGAVIKAVVHVLECRPLFADLDTVVGDCKGHRSELVMDQS